MRKPTVLRVLLSNWGVITYYLVGFGVKFGVTGSFFN